MDVFKEKTAQEEQKQSFRDPVQKDVETEKRGEPEYLPGEERIEKKGSVRFPQDSELGRLHQEQEKVQKRFAAAVSQTKKKKPDLYDRAQYDEYASVYMDKKSAGKRAKAMKNKKSRLYVKELVAKKAEENRNFYDQQTRKDSYYDIYEFSNRISEGELAYFSVFFEWKSEEEKADFREKVLKTYANGDKATALDRMYESLRSIEEKDINLGRDTDIMDHIGDFHSLQKNMERYRTFLRNNPEYWFSLGKEKQNEITKTIRRLTLISEYAICRENIVTSNIYRSHYNSEIGMNPDELFGLTPLLAKSHYLSMLLHEAGVQIPAVKAEVLTENFFRSGEMKGAQELVKGMDGNFISRELEVGYLFQMKRSLLKLPKQMLEELNGGVLDLKLIPMDDQAIEERFREKEKRAGEENRALLPLSDFEAFRQIMALDTKDPEYENKLLGLKQSWDSEKKVSVGAYRTLDNLVQLNELKKESNKQMAYYATPEGKIEKLKKITQNRTKISQRNMSGMLRSKEGIIYNRQMQRERIELTYDEKDTIGHYESVINVADMEVDKNGMISGEEMTDKVISFASMNTALRKGIYQKGGGKTTSCKVYEHKMNMEYTTKMLEVMDKSELKQDTFVFRGTNVMGAFSFLGLPMDILKGLESEEDQIPVVEKYFRENQQKLNQGNTICMDKGFLSTSPFGGSVYVNAMPVVFHMNLKKGTKAMYLEGLHMSDTSEYELLVQSGTKFRLLKLEVDDNAKNDEPKFHFYMESVDEAEARAEEEKAEGKWKNDPGTAPV